MDYLAVIKQFNLAWRKTYGTFINYFK